MADIVVIGSLNMDFVAFTERAPCEGETLIGDSFAMAPGGKGANQAFAAAKLGADVAMCGRIGLDAYGALLKADLEAVGCDITCIREQAGASGAALITVETSTGANRIVVIPGANATYTPDEWRIDAAVLAGAKIALFQLETPIETVLIATASAKAAGVKVMLDPAPARELPDELLRHVDFLTPNETELAALIGHNGEAMNERQLVDAVKALLSMYPSTVVAKLGARGCLAANQNEILRLSSPTVHAVDTTAAGDIFNAALAVAISDQAPLAQSCAFATHAAALSVARAGAQPSAPTRCEVEAAMRASPIRPTIIYTSLRTTP